MFSLTQLDDDRASLSPELKYPSAAPSGYENATLAFGNPFGERERFAKANANGLIAKTRFQRVERLM